MALSIIMEIGPVFTPIMIVGQAGSAMRSEIGIQRNTESKSKIEIASKVLLNGNEVNLSYRLANIKDRGWQVYDVLVEGVNMVSNYRKQFDEHFQRKSAADLIDLLKNKLKTQVDYTHERLMLQGTDTINDLPEIIDFYYSITDSAIDPYAAVRDRYAQFRANQVRE